MNISWIRILRLRLPIGCALLSLLGAPNLSAQGGDLGDARRAKALVEDTDAYERQQRAQLEKEIAKKKSETIEKLKRLSRKYKDLGERREAREIRRLLSKLESKIKDTQKDPDDEPEQLTSRVFQYGQDYFFKSNKISGKITFMENGKVNMIFTAANTTKNEDFNFEEKEDHILIKNGGILGKIYVSEIPKSSKESIMIRLGGKLLHEVVTAKMK